MNEFLVYFGIGVFLNCVVERKSLRDNISKYSAMVYHKCGSIVEKITIWASR